MTCSKFSGLGTTFFFILLFCLLSVPSFAATVDVTEDFSCIITQDTEDKSCTVLGTTYPFLKPSFICSGEKEFPGTPEKCWVATLDNRNFNPGQTRTVGPFEVTFDLEANDDGYTAFFSFHLAEDIITIDQVAIPEEVGLKSDVHPQVILTSEASQPVDTILEITRDSGFLTTGTTSDLPVTVLPGTNTIDILNDSSATNELGKVKLTIRAIVILDDGTRVESGKPVTISYEVVPNIAEKLQETIAYAEPQRPSVIGETIALIIGALATLIGILLIIFGTKTKKKTRSKLVLSGFGCIIIGIAIIGIVFQTQQTSFSEEFADGYVPYGTGATDLHAYFQVSTNEYGGDVEVGTGEVKIDATGFPPSSTISSCGNNINNIAQSGIVELSKAAYANLKFTIAALDAKPCYMRNGEAPAGGASVAFKDCILRDPGDYRVDIEINGQNAYVSKGNTRVCVVPKSTVPIISAGYGSIHVTDIRVRKPFSCTQAEGEMLAGEIFEAGETISAESTRYDLVRLCPTHLPIIVDVDQRGSDVDFTLYQRLAEGETITVPTGQVWIFPYVFDAREAGIQDTFCAEFYNPKKGDCDTLSGYVNVLSKGVVDTEEGVNVIVPKEVCPGTKLPDGSCVDYITPSAYCPGTVLETGACVRFIEPEAITLEPDKLCPGIRIDGECITFEQMQSAVCKPGDALDPVDGLCKGEGKQPYPPFKSSEEACKAINGLWKDKRCVLSVEVIEEIVTLQKEKIITLTGDPAEKEDIEQGIAPIPIEQGPSPLTQVLVASGIMTILITIAALTLSKKGGKGKK